MPILATAFLIKVSQTQLVVAAGVLCALVLSLALIAQRRRGFVKALVLYGVPATAAVAVIIAAILIKMADDEQSAARQSLLKQAAELDRSVLTPGSVLACADGSAGETVGNACEKTIFATPQSAATAVAYIGARIDLLKEASALAPDDRGLLRSVLAGTRRTITLDRYGIAAHVLAERDGCTAQHCAIFPMLDQVEALKSNLNAQAFDQYVSRYAASWEEPTRAVPKLPSTHDTPAAAAAPVVSALPTAPPDVKGTRAAIRPDESWDFPSADSIPAVSIVTPEPKLTKDAAARLAEGLKKAEGLEKAPESKAKERKKSAEKPTSTTEETPKHSQPSEPLELH